MSRTPVHSQPGYLLQQRKCRETSLIVDVLTRDYGIITLWAKGVRKPKSRLAGLFFPFNALDWSYSPGYDMKFLNHVELASSPVQLQGAALYSGFYINELIGYLLPKDDPCPEIFDDYQVLLQQLTQHCSIEPTLRFFELSLLEWLGYGLDLNYDGKSNRPIVADKDYVFDPDYGICTATNGYISGQTLIDLQQGQLSGSLALMQTKKLMRVVIDFYLQGRELKSRKVFADMIKRLPSASFSPDPPVSGHIEYEL